MFTGTIAEGVTVDAGQVVTFLAEPGAKLTRSDSGSIITVKDDQTSLAIYDLEVANAPSGVGVLVSFDSGAPTISLVRTKVRNNSSGGLFVNGGTVTVSDSEFSENGGSGMFMSSAATAVVTKSVFRRNKENGYREDSSTTTLTENLFLENAAMGVVLETTRATVRRNTVLQNMQGGVRIGNRSMFEVTDNFVIYNGRALGPTTSGAGGVIISVTLDGRFERNTIAFNESTGAARAGIQCAGSLVSAGANLVYHNTEADGAGGTKTDASTQVNTTSDCQFGNTLSLATHETHLGFRSPLNAPFDFHLTMATPRVVVDSAGPCTGADFDGEPRPRGDACDMGADELAP